MTVTQVINSDGEWIDGEPTKQHQEYRNVIQLGDKQAFEYLIYQIPPPPDAKILLSEIAVFGASKVGQIWWIPTNQAFTLTANAALPDSQMMVMIEKVVRDDSGQYQAVSDTRVVATIASGVITIKSQFKESGNYRIKAERLNLGLKEIGAPFTLDFELIEFDAYEPEPA